MSKKIKAGFAFGLFLVVLLVISWKVPSGSHEWPIWLVLIAIAPFALWASIAAFEYDKERRGED